MTKAQTPSNDRTYTEQCELDTVMARISTPVELISPKGTRVRVGANAAKARLDAGYRIA